MVLERVSNSPNDFVSVASDDQISASHVEGPSITAVVCVHTYGRWSSITELVKRLLDQVRPIDQICIVVDHNNGVLEHARLEWQDIQKVTVIPNTSERGLSGARNCGVAAARGDIIAFIDDDAIPYDNQWSTKLVAGFSDPNVMVLGGEAIPRWLSDEPSWLPSEFLWTVGCSYTGQPTTTAVVRNVLGCNMAIIADAFHRLGAFETSVGRGRGSLPMGAEETEICIRIARHYGANSVVYEPTLRVEHAVSQDRTTVKYFARRCYAEGLSKALLSGISGSDSALSTETTYATTVLPKAIAREGIGMVLGGRPSRGASASRILATVMGLSLTVAGYLAGTIRSRLHRAHTSLDPSTTPRDASSQG